MARLSAFPMKRLRSGPRGAGTVTAAVLATVLSGVFLATWHAAENARVGAAIERESGRLWAGWFLALHRAAQQGLVPATVWMPGDVVEVAAADIRSWGAAPAGLREDGIGDVGMRFGLLDDDAGVAMAFAVLTPASGWADNMRKGALKAGLADVAESGTVGGAASAMAANEGAIAAVLGGALDDGSLFATADWAFRRADRALHRRAQPGRPELSRMQAAVSFDTGFGVVNAGAVDGGSAAAALDVVVGAEAIIEGDVSIGGVLRVAGRLDAAAGLVAPELEVGTRLQADEAKVSGTLTAANATVTRRLRSGTMDIAGALDAGSLDAGSHATAPTADVAGPMSVGSCSGCSWP